MQPSDLRTDSFSRYPAQGRSLAVSNLATLQRIPLALLPLFLRQLFNYDWLFPPEQRDAVDELGFLSKLPSPQFEALMQPFAALHLSAEISQSDWINQPAHFADQLSACLWSTHQIDAYHAAAKAYEQQLETAVVKRPPETPRYTIVLVGAGVAETQLELFRKLRPHGTLFTAVDPKSGSQAIFNALQTRAQRYPAPYAHWYIDGEEPHAALGSESGISVVAYKRLAPATRKELAHVTQFSTLTATDQAPGPFAESLSSYMEDMKPEDLGLRSKQDDLPLRHFEMDLLTEGAGTQVFSTSFVQWAARECLHRAQPLTLVARFRPRQEAAPMSELLARDPFAQKTDVQGSLVDADMGAFYTWINQSRLPGADQSRFLAWFEDHSTAIAIGPSMARGASSDAPTDLAKILGWMS